MIINAGCANNRGAHPEDLLYAAIAQTVERRDDKALEMQVRVLLAALTAFCFL